MSQTIHALFLRVELHALIPRLPGALGSEVTMVHNMFLS